MSESNEFTQLASELQAHISQMLSDIVTEPIRYALDQLPVILQKQDWTEDQKAEAIQRLQLAIVGPLVNASVNAAQASQMDLGTFFNYAATAWEHVRSQLMAKIGQEMLSKAPGMGPDGI